MTKMFEETTHAIAYEEKTDEYFCICGAFRIKQQETAKMGTAAFREKMVEHIVKKESRDEATNSTPA